MTKSDLSIMCTQFAGLLAFAQNAQANFRRLGADERGELERAYAACKKGTAYGLADSLGVMARAAKHMYEAAKAAKEEDK